MNRYEILINKNPMIPLKKALELTDRVLIEDQKSIRAHLMADMVGQLYPAILYDEICALNKRSSDLRIENNTSERVE